MSSLIIMMKKYDIINVEYVVYPDVFVSFETVNGW